MSARKGKGHRRRVCLHREDLRKQEPRQTVITHHRAPRCSGDRLTDDSACFPCACRWPRAPCPTTCLPHGPETSTTPAERIQNGASRHPPLSAVTIRWTQSMGSAEKVGSIFRDFVSSIRSNWNVPMRGRTPCGATRPNSEFGCGRSFLNNNGLSGAATTIQSACPYTK